MIKNLIRNWLLSEKSAQQGNGWTRTEGTLTDTAFWSQWRSGAISQYERLATVFACVRVISESVAQVPLVLYRRLPNGGREPATDHPLSHILTHGPNGLMTAFEWKEYMTAGVLLHGRAVNHVIKSPLSGRLTVDPLLPTELGYTRTKAGIVFRRSGDFSTEIPRSELAIVSYRKTDPRNPWGTSVIDFNRLAMESALAADEYGQTVLRGKGRLRGVALVPLKMGKEQLNEFRDHWRATYGANSDGTNEVAVIPEGGDYKSIGMSSSDMQYIEQAKKTRQEICGIFGVPPHKVGDLDGAKYNNVEHQNISFVGEAIIPNCDRIASSLNRDLLSDTEKKDLYLEFNTNALLMGDTESRIKLYEGLHKLGALSTNDILSRENMPRVPDGDARYISTNLMKLGLPYIPKVKDETGIPNPTV